MFDRQMAREGSILCKPTDDGMQRGVVHMKGAGSAGVINLKTRDKEMVSQLASTIDFVSSCKFHYVL